jgi:hypothetical protein
MQAPRAAVQIKECAAVGQASLAVPGRRNTARVDFLDGDTRCTAGQPCVHAPNTLACKVDVEVRAPSAFRPDAQECVRQSRAQAGHVWPALLLQCVILDSFDGVDNAGC